MNRGKPTFKDASISEENRQHIVYILKEEGFTEEQLNEMAWEKVWKLYLESVAELLDRELGFINSALKRNPQLIRIFNPAIKAMLSHLEDLAKFAEETEKKRKKKK